MNWDAIATVAAVVRAKSLLGAAKELGVKHSSVSRRLAAIEAELGEPLFVRGRRLAATALAVEIEAHAANMAVAARHLEAALALRRARRGSELVITTSDALVPLLLRAVARCAGAPRVRLVVTDDERELEPGTIDMALRPTGAPSRALRGRRIGVLAVGVYRQKGARMAVETWVLPSDSMRQRASLRWLRNVPAGASAALECDRLLALRDACVAGLGLATLPCFLAHGDSRLELVSALEGGTPLWLFVATAVNSEHFSSSFASDLTRCLKSEKAAWRPAE